MIINYFMLYHLIINEYIYMDSYYSLKFSLIKENIILTKIPNKSDNDPC